MRAIPALAVAFLFASACADEPKREIAPTAPTSRSATMTSAVGVQTSTVCLAYARDMALARAELKDKPSSERALKRTASLNRLMKDACP